MRDEAVREFRASIGDIELREATDDKPAQIVGYAAVFDRVADLGWFKEEVAPGTFAETIAGDDIRALVDHTPSRILGRNTAGTLRLAEDKVGLRMEIDVPDTSIGADMVVSIKRGDVSGASFGFRTIDDEWSTKDGIEHRRLTKVELFDVGPVAFPAYADTEVGIRSIWDNREARAPERPAAAGKHLEQLRRLRRRQTQIRKTI